MKEGRPMDEAKWGACGDSQRMLAFVLRRLSERKQRLFAVACCRRIWHLFRREESRQAVEAAERYAEGTARAKELAAYYHPADSIVRECPEGANRHAAQAAANTAEQRILWTAWNVAEPEWDPSVAAAAAAGCYAGQLRRRREAGQRAAAWAELSEQQAQCDILRDLTGNPFRASEFDTAWSARNGGVVANMAEVIYAANAFDRLPILADALEDAGCTDAAILEHCRGPGPHVRGCFVVDLLLSKN
jgi:hypothetical protein